MDAIDADFQSRIDEGMELMAEEVEWSFRMYASKELNSSKDAYLKALNVTAVDRTVVVEFSGSNDRNNGLANAVEFGSQRFDLKPGFLRNGEKRYAMVPIKPKGVLVGHRRLASLDEPGWIHPGIKPRNLRDKVMADVDDHIASEVFDRVFGSVKI